MSVMIEYRTGIEDITVDELQGFFVGWKSPPSPEEHLAILSSSRHVVLAYDTDAGQVAGFVNALGDGIRFAYIPMLEVLPTYQRRGIGRELMKRILTVLEDIPCIDLICDPHMQDYYTRFGLVKSCGMVIRKQMAGTGDR